MRRRPGLPRISPGTDAGIDQLLFEQPVERAAVKLRAFALPVRPVRTARPIAFIPLEPEPEQIAAVAFDDGRITPVSFDILDAHDDPAAPAPHRQPRDEKGHRIAEMERPGRTRGEPPAYFPFLIHDCRFIAPAGYIYHKLPDFQAGDLRFQAEIRTDPRSPAGRKSVRFHYNPAIFH